MNELGAADFFKEGSPQPEVRVGRELVLYSMLSNQAWCRDHVSPRSIEESFLPCLRTTLTNSSLEDKGHSLKVFFWFGATLSNAQKLFLTLCSGPLLAQGLEVLLKHWDQTPIDHKLRQTSTLLNYLSRPLKSFQLDDFMDGFVFLNQMDLYCSKVTTGYVDLC